MLTNFFLQLEIFFDMFDLERLNINTSKAHRRRNLELTGRRERKHEDQCFLLSIGRFPLNPGLLAHCLHIPDNKIPSVRTTHYASY